MVISWAASPNSLLLCWFSWVWNTQPCKNKHVNFQSLTKKFEKVLVGIWSTKFAPTICFPNACFIFLELEFISATLDWVWGLCWSVMTVSKHRNRNLRAVPGLVLLKLTCAALSHCPCAELTGGFGTWKIQIWRGAIRPSYRELGKLKLYFWLCYIKSRKACIFSLPPLLPL